ncbi:recombinase family protein [Priestia aryabhattai]|uniref:recombinase family protein n=1 Tax=Priestia aryabhattai TaxID=412384 RepID=UPI0028814FEA|nr:recombinase family protein [Priestia aryabhattai]MDT0150415.1 recombinase family protein [Priestia aryabhattai]MDT0155982.1 recombinase family protein [Priestia aryabhattai]
MKYGYTRISHRSQNLSRQTQSLTEYGVDELYEEIQSGRDDSRPVFQQLLQKLQPHDVIVIHSLDRLMRSTIHLLKVVNELREKEVGLVSLNEPWLDISGENPQSEFLLTIFAAVAQLERQNTLVRQREGIEIAKLKGDVQFGRPKKNRKKIDHAIQLHREKKHTVKEIEQITGVSKSTLYRELAKEKTK